jgi:DNA polymerase III subunit alpha
MTLSPVNTIPPRLNTPTRALKTILEETYGIPVYQEQILQIANIVAGYSLGEADILRRAIGKKKRSILEKEKNRFIKGASEKGYEKQNAEDIWGFIDKFAGYGFNKSHSASYAMIAYQTAYLKVLYPVEYMAAFLSIESAPPQQPGMSGFPKGSMNASAWASSSYRPTSTGPA